MFLWQRSEPETVKILMEANDGPLPRRLDEIKIQSTIPTSAAKNDTMKTRSLFEP